MKLFKSKSKGSNDPSQAVASFAKQFVALDSSRSKKFDYSIDSLSLVDEMLDEASQAHKATSLDAKTLDRLANLAGSYIFEVLRRKFGGRYKWYDKFNQPILVIGEPEFELAFLAIEKARGRIVNGVEDNIPFFTEGIIQKVNSKESALII